MYSLMMFDSYRIRSRSTEHRDLVVRVHHRQVFGLVEEIDVDDLEIHALLVQHDAAALAEGQVVPEYKVIISDGDVRSVWSGRAAVNARSPFTSGHEQ
jgi:hypothetical protein